MSEMLGTGRMFCSRSAYFAKVWKKKKDTTIADPAGFTL